MNEHLPPVDLVRVATAGSVDDGKSTLIGRLLLDTKTLMQDQIEELRATTEQRGGKPGELDLALITDGLRSEREQGITIDVAYRYFTTPRRNFILADTPGHVTYTRNMATGASTAQVALILVDARTGVVEQTRRHTFIASLLGVPHFVVCVNKMDLVDWSQEVFDAVVADFSDFSAKLNIADLAFVPISALRGDNVIERSTQSPWYEGSPLLYHLETVHVASDENLVDLRFPVQWVIRPTDETQPRRYAGRLAGGILRAGEEVIALPSGARTRIVAVETADGRIEQAVPPLSVSVQLADHLDIGRGEVLCREHSRPTVRRDVDATVCWMANEPLLPGQRLLLKHLTTTTPVEVTALLHRIDVTTLSREPAISGLALNDIGHVALRTATPLVYDEYHRNRTTGSFILIDEATNNTVGAGMLRAPMEGVPDPQPAEVTWDTGRLDRARRWSTLDTEGAVVWITGLPASGKSTLAAAIEEQLVLAGRSAYRLDGDNLRHGLNRDLGFSSADRTENVRRTAHVAALLADAGTVVLVALVSPYEVDREHARHISMSAGIRFVEVFIDTPLAECERRDPKGLYARARRGQLSGMTGIDSPYERPQDCDITITATAEGLGEQVERILAALASA